MEAFNFTVANEDCCLYTFDMRKLSSATCVHKVRRGKRLAAAVGSWLLAGRLHGIVGSAGGAGYAPSSAFQAVSCSF